MLSSRSNSYSQSCSDCGARTIEKPLTPFPLKRQIVFGVSFLVFLFFYKQLPPLILWIWSGGQLLLGGWLLHGRIQSARRVYHCVRCQSTVG